MRAFGIYLTSCTMTPPLRLARTPPVARQQAQGSAAVRRESRRHEERVQGALYGHDPHHGEVKAGADVVSSQPQYDNHLGRKTRWRSLLFHSSFRNNTSMTKVTEI